MKLIKKSAVLVLSFIILGTAGCGNNNITQKQTDLLTQPVSLTGEAAVQTTTVQDTTEPVQPEVKTMNLAVYYLKNNRDETYLVREIHKVNKSRDVARAALLELIAGKPLTQGAFRILPKDTKVLGIAIANGLATVNFSGEVLKANAGAQAESLGIESIVNTLTEFPSIKKVRFIVDGQMEKARDWWGHVGLYKQPFERSLISVMEPAIWVTIPAAGQTISNPVTIRGNAMVFEGVVSLRIKDAKGNVLAKGTAQAAAGIPDRGDFTAELSFNTTAAGKGRLEVFEVSMKDGSEINKVIIPVNWQKN